MFCKYCGKEVEPDAVICIHCGRSLETRPVSTDTGSIGWGVLGFFFPIIGLILYLVWKDEKPYTAKMAGKGALIGVITTVVLGICYGIVLASLMSQYAGQFHHYSSIFQNILR